MDAGEPVFRVATQGDLPVVAGIVDAAYRHYIARIGRMPAPMQDDYAALIAGGRVWVAELGGAELGGAVRGILVLIPQRDAMLLDNIAVAPEAQGRGLGRRMLAFAEAQALRAGHGAIRLYTNEAMTENIRLYTRTGYVQTHRAEEKGLRRVYMSKRLVPPEAG